jgi:hypothetical protein
MESDEFKSKLKNTLFNSLKNSKDHGWSDVELLLKDFAIKFDDMHKKKLIYSNLSYDQAIEKFNSEYKLLKEQLKTYLNGELNSTKLNQVFIENFNKYIHKLIREHGNIDIVTFNYTQSTVNAIEENAYIKIYEIHNNIKSEMIFGTDTITNRADNRLSFIEKESAINYAQVYDFNKYFQEAKNIIFYGHSLGITDQNYFKRYFNFIASLNERKKQNFVFHYYDGNLNDPKGTIEMEKLNMNLKYLTNNKLHDFKQNCIYEFVPTSRYLNL